MTFMHDMDVKAVTLIKILMPRTEPESMNLT